ncbi:MAG: GNAT family N-acetyltransferase [Bacilli bacterium]|nr:GNAT family N-acetyltransferase [Bacilli bacterium]
MKFRTYEEGDYELLRGFLIRLAQQGDEYLHWNWGRFEWAVGNWLFNMPFIQKIGLCFDGDVLVGAAFFDTTFCTCECLLDHEFEFRYPEFVDYAIEELKGEGNIGVFVNDRSQGKVECLSAKGFSEDKESAETMLELDLGQLKDHPLPAGYHFSPIDSSKEEDKDRVLWVCYQEQICRHIQGGVWLARQKKESPYMNPTLSIALCDPRGEWIGYVAGWFDPQNDFLHIDPIRVVSKNGPEGLASALVTELLRQGKALGARRAIVLGGLEPYAELGFKPAQRYALYFKPKA